MMTPSYLAEVAGYERWAPEQLLTTLAANGLERSKPHDLVGHSANAFRVWQARIDQRPIDGIVLFPEPSFAETRAWINEACSWFEDFARRGFDHAEAISYRNMKGESFTSTIGEIFTHVFLHAHYHRGQANMWLRENGHQPVWTDYIVYKRSQGK